MPKYKLIGAGPMAGWVGYGTIRYAADSATGDSIALVLDSMSVDSAANYGIALSSGTRYQICVSVLTGAAKCKSVGETDLVTVAPSDLPALRAAWVDWMGKEPTRDSA